MEYAYVNSRIRSMKGALLSKEALEALISKPDLESLIAELHKSAYSEELEKASVRFSGISLLDIALRNDLVKVSRKILEMAGKEEEESDWHFRFLIARWDLHNVKTILRGKAIATRPEEILECIVPAGELDEAACIELIRQPDIKATIDLLATWGVDLARPLTRNYTRYLESRDMSVLEYALDRFYYEHAIERLKKGETENDEILLDFLATEVDTINIKTVLRGVRDKMHAEDLKGFLIRGGKSLSMERLLAIAASPALEAAVRQLAGTPYSSLSTIGERLTVEGRISEFEKELERLLMKKAMGLFLKDPLSIGIPLAYLYAKEIEFRNIRLIGRGKIEDIPEKELREALIRV